jgi:hypothetical protein
MEWRERVTTTAMKKKGCVVEVAMWNEESIQSFFSVIWPSLGLGGPQTRERRCAFGRNGRPRPIITDSTSNVCKTNEKPKWFYPEQEFPPKIYYLNHYLGSHLSKLVSHIFVTSNNPIAFLNLSVL